MNDDKEKISYYAIIPANVRYDDDLKPNAKLLYGEITALCNEKGYCWATNTYFAKLYGVSTFTISRWISSLISKGYIKSIIVYKDNSKVIQERRLTIANSIDDVYNAVNNPIDKKSNTPMTKRAIPYCQKEQYPIDEKRKENNTSNTTFNNTKNIYTAFERLWAIYPNKKGKDAAYKAFEKAIKAGTSVDDIERGINAYNAQIAREKTEKRFIKHGSTFFNQSAWLDDYGTSGGDIPNYEGGENILDELDGFI